MEPMQAGPKPDEPMEQEASRKGIMTGVAMGANIIIGVIPVCIGCCEIILACDIAAGTKQTKGQAVPHEEALFDMVAGEDEVVCEKYATETICNEP